jgi:8-oxo-dGTP pyrophosphatase MutT (NUDIX family)
MAIGRYPKSRPFSAAAFLYDAATQSLLLHLRDSKARKYPDSWAFFGGRGKRHETDVACCLRELREEICLVLRTRELRRLREYHSAASQEYHVTFYAEKAVPLSELDLNEGACFAWVPLGKVMALPMNKYHQDDIRYFAAKRGLLHHLK